MKGICFSLNILTLLMFLTYLTCSKAFQIGPCKWVFSDTCPDPDFIKVYLFTRKNVEKGQLIYIADTEDNMTSSYFNPNNPNKLIIHGFNADMDLYALVDIKAEYLNQGEANVWMVNYPKLSAGPLICYPFAVHNIAHVGHCLAQLVTALHRHSSPNIHIIGYSLGAHVANYMAEKLKPIKLPRITGLDPAGPMFTGRNIHVRLDSSDAEFVDVVHTNALLQGILDRSGHVDFYMNGGVNQPGCFNESNSFNCEHIRAAEYFVESIRTKVEFLGWQCKSYTSYLMGNCKPSRPLVQMGEHCIPGNTGFYLVYTAAEKPYALGGWTGELFKQKGPNMNFIKLTRRIATELLSNRY